MINSTVNLKCDKWIMVMHFINTSKDLNVSQISRDAEVQYSHLHKILNALEKKKLIKSEYVSRNRLIELTAKGLRFLCIALNYYMLRTL